MSRRDNSNYSSEDAIVRCTRPIALTNILYTGTSNAFIKSHVYILYFTLAFLLPIILSTVG